MAIDAQQGERGISRNRHYLAYRETLILVLGFLETRQMTQNEFYAVYKRVHQQLTQAEIVEFSLPTVDAFQAMVRKLIKKGEVHQVLHDDTYVLSLTDQGEAKFDVMVLNLEMHPKMDRIINIINFYRKLPVN